MAPAGAALTRGGYEVKARAGRLSVTGISTMHAEKALEQDAIVTSVKLKVFISYARHDMVFADVLVSDLEANGFEVMIDRRDLPFGEQWQKVLKDFIIAADAVVWLVSSQSINSHWCNWELGEVEQLRKRLVPIRIAPVANTDLPKTIGKVHILPVEGTYTRELHLALLVTAISTDHTWLQEHTRLGNIARRWHLSGRPRHELLHGAAIDATEQWLRYRPATAPVPTEIMRVYIAASRKEDLLAAGRRRRTRSALIGLSLVVVAVTGLAYFGYLDPTYLEGRFNRMLGHWRDTHVKIGEHTRDCWSTACPEMVLVPAGEFVMGSPPDEVDRVRDEGPQHKVTIARPFLVAKYETTFAEWDACIAAGGCKKFPETEWGRGQRPVVGVAWNDIQQYLAWLSAKTGMSYRLLTESEWEYAARGTNSADAPHFTYAWGMDFRRGLANCLLCTEEPAKQPLPVGSFPPNAFGLHDMIGNAYEFVRDCYAEDYTTTPTDGSAAAETPNCMRVARGGAFSTSAKFVRPAYRNRQLPGQGYRNFGFRVARNLTWPDH